jgi:hypothetical protein
MASTPRQLRHRGLAWVLTLVATLGPAAAHGFPPYRSTDAETAEPWTLEARLGLLRLTHDSGANEYASPLVRVNLGFPHRLELVTELEVLPAAGRVGDAAAGLKWVPLLRQLSLGVEALALLPVSRSGGAGVEAQALATLRLEPVLLHLNAGGFYDVRPEPHEHGWQTSLLGEVRLGRWRPGLEVFVRQPVPHPVWVVAGAGLIVQLGRVLLHAGLHVGLTAAAPDLVTSFWVSGVFPLRPRRDQAP